MSGKVLQKLNECLERARRIQAKHPLDLDVVMLETELLVARRLLVRAMALKVDEEWSMNDRVGLGPGPDLRKDG